MADSKYGTGIDRSDLSERIELIEAMIAEGRRATVRHGWIFVLWGVVELVGTVLQSLLPDSALAHQWLWPICLVAGALGTGILRRRRPRLVESVEGLHLRAIWNMMGLAMAVYVLGAMLGGAGEQAAYFAGVLVILGMAQAISAAILRWRVQGAVAALWWLGALATFLDRQSPLLQRIVFAAVVGLGLVGFGLYAVVIERRGEHVRAA